MVRVKRLRVIEFGAHPAQYNMDLDRRLLELCDTCPDQAFLRFYTWMPPALSLGHFEPEGAVDLVRARRDGIDVVRRPTGGRIVLHREDLTYTVVMPREPRASVEETYLELAGGIVAGLTALGAEVALARGQAPKLPARARPCFLSAVRHEITHRGRKLVGSAQVVGRRAVLQHGSIPIGHGYLDVVAYLARSDAEQAVLAREMTLKTACLEDVVGRGLAPIEVATALGDAFAALFGSPVEHLPAPPWGTNTLDSLSGTFV
jgi:lipoyl(octanoyl) transferase